MADQGRARRLAERIHQIVARMLLERKVKDPRLGFVTITDVRVTGDLHDASIFYTVYGDQSDLAGTAAALRSATGLLRSEVGRQTGVKFTPTLTFILDALPDTAGRIEELLGEAQAADAAVTELARRARFAGDPDPYRRDEAEDDESAALEGMEGERA